MHVLRDKVTRREPIPDARAGIAAASGRAAIRRQRSRPVTPWWLWPHLWSLDAPLIAVTWQSWWAHAAKVNLPWQQSVVLALAVWLIYLADRLVDVSRHPSTDHGTARHTFYAETRPAVARLVIGLCIVLAFLTPRWLPPGEFCAGLCLLALAGVYFWTTHRATGPGWTNLLPKEAAVAGLFALGTAVFVLCRLEHTPGRLWWGLGLWSLLCFLNCALITRWESSVRDRRDPASLQTAFPKTFNALPVGCALLSAGSLFLSAWGFTSLFLPVALGALLLWWLDRRQKALSADSLRVLADAVLLTPWVFLVV